MTNGEKNTILHSISQSALAIYTTGYNDGVKDGNINNGTFEAKIKEAYEKGLNDAWECAKKITLPVSHGGASWEKLKEIYNYPSYPQVMKEFSAAEAIAKMEKANKIEVGDEVITTYNETRGVVTRLFENINGVPFATQINCYGVSEIDNLEDLQKTGRHFPQIAEILKQMREDK